MKGIISHLTLVCDGNVHEKDEIVLAASSVHNNGGRAKWKMKHAVDHKINTYFCVNDSPIDRICFHFKNKIVEPTHYSVCLS
jgi:hypothetical protein